MSPPLRPRPRGFPLASLFLLVALFAALAALLSPLAAAGLRSTPLTTMLTAPLLGALWGACLGGIVGLYHYQRQRGVLVGLSVGGVVGAMCGPMVVVSMSGAWHMLLISAVSALILLGAAYLYGFVNSKDPVSRRAHYAKMLAQQEKDNEPVNSAADPQE